MEEAEYKYPARKSSVVIVFTQSDDLWNGWRSCNSNKPDLSEQSLLM